MFKSIELFQSAHKMAQHAASQQAVVAGNIANADTPNFRAMTIPELQSSPQSLPMARSAHVPRAAHIVTQGMATGREPVIDRSAEIAPNGNSVSLEGELLKSIDAERQHSRAVTVYQSALGILRTSLGRGR